MRYSFRKQLRDGQKHERFLDDYYSTRFHIEPADREEERRGIDRWFTDKRNGSTYAIQYKADTTAARTGNAFVETVSVDTKNIPGWAYTCEADFIIYYVVGCGPAYVIRPVEIRKRLGSWEREFESRAIPNQGYNTVGLLVPLDEFERIAYARTDI